MLPQINLKLSLALVVLSAVVLLAAGHALVGKADARAARPAVDLVLDPEARNFRFFIDGQEVARIDDAGLHVREGIAYGGSLTDVGPDGYAGDADQQLIVNPSTTEPGKGHGD